MIITKRHVSEETKKRISKSCVENAKINPNYGMRGKKFSEETKKKMSLAKLGRKISIEVRKNMSLAQIGKKRSKETRRKMSVAKTGIIFSKKHLDNLSKSHINKRRTDTIWNKNLTKETSKIVERIAEKNKNYGFERFLLNGDMKIGNRETNILDKQEKDNKCKILRQYRIPDMRYIVDGYDKENNIVYEVYEKFHENQKEKDLQRQYNIMNKLQCGFSIIYDYQKTF